MNKIDQACRLEAIDTRIDRMANVFETGMGSLAGVSFWLVIVVAVGMLVSAVFQGFQVVQLQKSQAAVEEQVMEVKMLVETKADAAAVRQILNLEAPYLKDRPMLMQQRADILIELKELKSMVNVLLPEGKKIQTALKKPGCN